MAWEAVIGLECHIQLATRTKMFCGCPVAFGAEPDTNVCPVCLGLPGALPRVNGRAIEAAVSLGLALGCEVREISVFARKNYFYPDMPKNYQITQYDRPICERGALSVPGDGDTRTFALTRIHLEEDAGKSFHPERHGDRRLSRVDFNRAGVPLLELVTEPVLRTPAECAAFLTQLRRLVRWLGISGGDMEKGQLRCDANVSLRPVGATTLGTKTELKNLNTIKGVERGVTREIARQTAALESGERIIQATLLYDADRDALEIMRTKEQAHDYRYFPDPDLPSVIVSEALRASAMARAPESPWARERRYVETYALPLKDAQVLTEHRDVSDYFEACQPTADAAGAKVASHWVMRDVLGALNERGWTLAEWSERVPAERFRDFLVRVADRSITGPIAKELFVWLQYETGTVAELLERHGVKVAGDADELRPIVRAVLDEHPGPVQQVLEGREATFGFLVGQVMKRAKGAVPQVVNQLLREELATRKPS